METTSQKSLIYSGQHNPHRPISPFLAVGIWCPRAWQCELGLVPGPVEPVLFSFQDMIWQTLPGMGVGLDDL